MNRTVATWLSLVTILVLVAVAIATVGLVLGAKATDEKADDTAVTEQIGELSGDVGRDLEELRSAVEELGGAVDQLAAAEAEQIDLVGSLEAAVADLDERVGAIEEQLGLDQADEQ